MSATNGPSGGLRTPIRVLSLIPTFWPRQGGAQMVLAAIADGLRTRIDDVVLTRGYDGTPRYEEMQGFRVVRYTNPAPERWKDYATGTYHVSLPAKVCVGLFDVVGSVAPLYRLTHEADLVHLHFPLPLGLSALFVRAIASRPLVVTVHGNADVYELPRALAPLTRAVLRRADAVVGVGQDLATHLCEEFGLRHVTVVPNGVDTELYRPAPRPPSDELRLLSVSRIVPRKNIDVLIAAVKALAREGHRNLRLTVAGSGPGEAEIEALARDSDGTTSFVGFVDEVEKRRLFAEADAFVQLSTREGLSVATLEALASGLPCVVSNRPGVREPVTPGKTGFLVNNPESVEEVMSVLRRLLASLNSLDDMKRAARATALERYSLRAMAEGYWNVFESMMTRGAA